MSALPGCAARWTAGTCPGGCVPECVARLGGARRRPREAARAPRHRPVGGGRGLVGVTLGLVYAQRYPKRVVAMVLGAITTGDRREIDWITRAMGRIFPREWDEFVRFLPPA